MTVYETLYENGNDDTRVIDNIDNDAARIIDVADDVPICRICLESEPSNFISPCKCSGTNAHVHELSLITI